MSLTCVDNVSNKETAGEAMINIISTSSSISNATWSTLSTAAMAQ